MTKALSLDLRRRVVRFVDSGHSRHEAAARFEVSVSFVVKLVAAWRSTGSYAPKPEGGWRYSKLDPHREFLLRRVAEQAGELTEMGVDIAPASLSRWYLRNGYRFKKNTAGVGTRSAGRSRRTPDLDRKASAADAARARPTGLR